MKSRLSDRFRRTDNQTGERQNRNKSVGESKGTKEKEGEKNM